MNAFSYSSVIQQYFSNIANDYKESAFLSKEVAARLIERLQWLRIDPTTLLDIGCGAGTCLLLQQFYPHANIIGIDITYEMLCSAIDRQNIVCADGLLLPLKDRSIDMIFANLLLPWCEASTVLFTEFKRVLRPGGLFLFATLGPDSMQEIQRIPQCIDMHHIGDMLVSAGYVETVMDREYLALQYQQSSQVIIDLKTQGLEYFYPNLTNSMLSVSELTFELIYGQAWRPASVSISIDKIARKVSD
jgi:malonyl-CoA O-methyltransferase